MENFNTRVYRPVSAASINTYQKYGAPRIAQARSYSEKEWERAVKPMLDDTRDRAYQQYQTLLGPHVDRIHAIASPYLETAQRSTAAQYQNFILPAYQKTLPYVNNAYGQSRYYIVSYGIPYSRTAVGTTTAFITRRLWPPVRVLYGQNVEPQLSKIRERLASYRDSKKLEAAVDEMDASSVSSESLAASTAMSTSTVVVGSTTSTSTIDSPRATESEAVTEELKRWQAKFAKAADKGAEDLASRIPDIASQHTKEQVEGVGPALVTQLEDDSSAAHASLKNKIMTGVRALPEDATEDDQHQMYDLIRKAIRSHGDDLKSKAQELRMWKLQSNDELTSLIDQASDSTLSVLDGIRDLGLQEIGMRWAASEHVTYSDWTEYHKLKKSFDDWRVTVAEVASNHKAVVQARQAAEEVEDRGMGVAQDAAEELARLKDVARWKIHARDVTNDFSSRKLPAAAARIGQKIMNKASSARDAATGSTSTQGMAESIISAATDSAASAASEASEAMHDASSSAASLAADATASASSITDPADSSSSSLLSAMSSAASTLSSSSPHIPPDTGSSGDSDDNLASSLSSAASSAASSMSASLSSMTDNVAASANARSSAMASMGSSLSSLASNQGQPIGAKASAVLASVAEGKLPTAEPTGTDAAASSLGSVASSITSAGGGYSHAATIAAGSAASMAENRASGVAGVVSQATDAAADAADSITSPIVVGASVGTEDVKNLMAEVSEAVQSKVEGAGEGYETITRTMKERASAVAEGEL